MNPAHFRHPDYAASFRCIGSDCEDTCCQGWTVPVDRDAFQSFESLPGSPLRTLILASLAQQPATAANGKPAVFAIIQMNDENHCPLLTEERLCQIQSEYGAALLPHTCATYPRVIRSMNGITETALTLSCPEAARLVLLHPALLHTDQPADEALAETTAPQAGNAPQEISPLSPWMGAIRDEVLNIVTNRSYLLWQRLFLLGTLCRRLDSIVDSIVPSHNDANKQEALTPDTAAEAPPRDLLAFLTDFDAAVASGALRGAMHALPTDDRVQLDAVLQLAGLMLHKSKVGPRFLECIHAFTTGIGNGPGATLDSLAAHYHTAFTQYFAPFFEHHPKMLENLLVNTILRVNFPFGTDAHASHAERSMNRQFVILAAQFALIRGLLIGVAGYHREQFSIEHVVHTVQAASKHFEHHPEFLKQIESWMLEHHLDAPRELTILVNEPAELV